MAGLGMQYYPNPLNTNPTSQFGNPATFTAAAKTQAGDYDKIMQQYADLAKSFTTNPLTADKIGSTSIAPQTSKYEQSGDVTRSLGNLADLSSTGGYSAGDVANIRERDISPIRSIYADSKREIERNRSLSGGYSPSFNAVSARMARDESDKIGGITTRANADIAQNVASNRIAAASPYASASASANAAKTSVDTHNTDIINQINQANADRATQVGEFNTQAQLEAGRLRQNNALGAIQGQASLYGTTPALVNTFGNQVVQANQLGQGQQDLNNRRLSTITSWK